VLPKIFHTNTSYEYWSRAGSLIHTSPDGKRDVPADGERAHLSSRGTAAFLPRLSANSGPEPSLAAQHLPNPNPVRWFWRALFVAMDDWVREGKAPPESRYPKIADGTLVRREALKCPEIPVFRTVKEMSMRSLAAPPDRVHEGAATRLWSGMEEARHREAAAWCRQAIPGARAASRQRWE
jgi:hypothetical protein